MGGGDESEEDWEGRRVPWGEEEESVGMSSEDDEGESAAALRAALLGR